MLCRRNEGKTVIKSGAALLGAAFLLLSGSPLEAQELPGGIIRLIEMQCEDGGGDPEALAEYFMNLMERPLNLNSADREVLESFPLLTPFMVASLLEYRREYGAVASAGELALVDGFDAAAVQEILPFVTFGSEKGKGEESPAGSRRRIRLSGRLTMRSKYDIEREGEVADGLPVPLYARFGIELNRRWSAGFTLESDRGERGFPDFYSFHIGARGISLSDDGRYTLESAVIGDYSLRFGQGLVLWNSFSLSGLSSPSAAIRREGGVGPYTSSDENRYFHGAGVTFGLPAGIRASFFYSNNGQDARVEGDYFVTKPEDGIHDSDALREARDALREELAGANFSWRCDWLKAGLTAAAYRYDRLDGRRTSYYNEHLRYDGWWGNASLDWLISVKGLRIFGEAALDRHLAFAGIAGAVCPLSSSMEVSLLYRYYSPRYIATHAGAYCRSNVNNEHGASAAVRWSPRRDIAVSSSLEYTYFPGARFGVREPSSSIKGYVDCEWAVSESHTLYAKVSGTYDSGRGTRLLRLRLGYSCGREAGFTAAARLEGSCAGEALGGLLYQEGGYRSPSGKWRLSVRATLFWAEDWDARIYCYESDMPGTFSVPAYYGKGTGLYAVLTYRPAVWLNVNFKCSVTKYFGNPGKDELGLRLQVSLPF